MCRTIPRPVQMTNIKDVLSNHQLPDPSRKWVESNTTDSFCRIAHRLINTKVLEHKIVGGFVYRTKNPKFKGRVVIFIEMKQVRTDCEAEPYTHIISFYYQGKGLLQHAWMRGECERRLLDTQEGVTFRYRNIERRRLQSSELQTILAESEEWRTVL